MMRRTWLLLALAPLAHAQFQLLAVNGNLELAVPPVYDLGHADPGTAATAQFRLRNVSTGPASVYTMTLAGTGFSLPSPPTLPLTLSPQQALDFAVLFKADAAGTYSAGLTLPGISVILTATVQPNLTFRISDPVDFGAVAAGSSALLHFAIENHTGQSLVVPPIVIRGTGFAVAGQSPAGAAIDPQKSATLDLAFAPPVNGNFTGTLGIGERSFTLSGTGIDPPLPKPLVSVDLPEAASGKQGVARVDLDAAARVGGSGSLTLDFQAASGATDSAVAFAAGGRSIPFTIKPGDTQAVSAPFQTGTTAGTLTFTATLGGVKAQASIAIAAAPVSVASAAGSRASASVTIQVSGFDNTRTAGQLAFAFYDRNGNQIGSAIPAAADFATFFKSSALGGLFLLQAVFPVNGDPAQIGAFEVQFTNTAGATKVARTSF